MVKDLILLEHGTSLHVYDSLFLPKLMQSAHHFPQRVDIILNFPLNLLLEVLCLLSEAFQLPLSLFVKIICKFIFP